MTSTHWSNTTKIWVLTTSSVLAFLALYQVRLILPSVGLALILAYIIAPVVDRIHRRTPLGRMGATALVFLALLAVLLTLPAVLVPKILAEARALDRTLIQNVMVNVVTQIRAYSENGVVAVFGLEVDLRPAYAEVIRSLQSMSTSVATRSINFLLSFASGFASTLLGLFLMLALSLYVTKDGHMLAGHVVNLAPPQYRDEVAGLLRDINQVWRDFFRGQIMLCLVVGVMTGVGLFALGVPNALLLGILAGVLELIPHLGPTLSMIPGLMIAYFMGSTHLALSPPWFTLLVGLMYLSVQQLENAVLVPRIIGGNVRLHPSVVLIGVMAGASVAGILGIFLAAPLLASVRIVGSYVHGKLLDSLAELPAVEALSPQEPAKDVAEVEEVTVERDGKDDVTCRSKTREALLPSQTHR